MSQRLRFFTGRFMTARDFRDDQDYHRSHRLLQNRQLHGWGVGCGLEVCEHPEKGCRENHVEVKCGFALDIQGRELLVTSAQIPPKIDRKRPDDVAGEAHHLLLCLQYKETEIELVPVLFTEGECDKKCNEYSRIEESVELVWHWVLESQLAIAWGWAPPAVPCHGAPPACRPAGHCCLDPVGPECVPLAFIRDRPGHPIEAQDIHMRGRHSLELKHELTHICEINWPHGGVVPRRHVQGKLHSLRVHFNRALQQHGHHHGGPRTFPGPHGINASTFVVQFGGDDEDLDFVVCTSPPSVENDCEAVFAMDPRHHGAHQPFDYLENHSVYVTLKCDFVLDCHHRAVDGNHLGGVLPTGDGVPGGTFESWFYVLPDHEYDAYRIAVPSAPAI